MSYKTWYSVPCKDHGRKLGQQAYASCYHDGRYIDQHVRALLTLGPKLDDQRALHRCANKRCIEPSHLYWGTQAQNIRDTEGLPGTRVKTRVLSWEEVTRVRASGGSQSAIAKQFNVSRTAIQQIRAGTRRGSS